MIASSHIHRHFRHQKFKFKCLTKSINNVVLSFFCLLIIVVHCPQGVLSKAGDSCLTSRGQKGECKEISNCPSIGSNKDAMMSTPFCRWDGQWPLYCCPNDKFQSKPQHMHTNKDRLTGSFGCGKRRGPKIRFVAGGEAAVKDSWPWMAAIFIQYPGKLRQFRCGGSLISQRWILTAAHCLTGSGLAAPQWVTVLLGAHGFRDGKIYSAEQIILHDGYKREERYHDIALIRLKDAVTYSQNMLPVCLPSLKDASKNYTNAMATVTGWGGDSFGGTASDVLRQVTLPVVSNYNCNQTYARLKAKSLPHGITDSLVCAGLREGGKDACQSDSGGPLVVSASSTSSSGSLEERWVILGVVSFGFQCALAGYPGVYSRVSYYMQWIKQNTGITEPTASS